MLFLLATFRFGSLCDLFQSQSPPGVTFPLQNHWWNAFLYGQCSFRHPQEHTHQSCEDRLSCPLPHQSEISLHYLLLVTKIRHMPKRRKETAPALWAKHFINVWTSSALRLWDSWIQAGAELQEKGSKKRKLWKGGDYPVLVSVSPWELPPSLCQTDNERLILKALQGRPRHGVFNYKRLKRFCFFTIHFLSPNTFPQMINVTFQNTELYSSSFLHLLSPSLYFIYAIPSLVPCCSCVYIYISILLSGWGFMSKIMPFALPPLVYSLSLRWEQRCFPWGWDNPQQCILCAHFTCFK